MLIWKVIHLTSCIIAVLANPLNASPRIFFMDECSNDVIYYNFASSAIIYSHRGYLNGRGYDFSFRCILRFQPALPEWRIAVKVLDYDLPVEPYIEPITCSDSLVLSNFTLSYYHNKIAVFDDRNQLASGEGTYICNLTRKKHGNGTLEYFSLMESHFYVGFETGSVAKGKGFKLLLTAFTSAVNSPDCASSRDRKSTKLFPCDFGEDAVCIMRNLTCDGRPNCPGTKNAQDESVDRMCMGLMQDTSFSLVDRFGMVASLLILIGSVLVVLACIVASVCLCRRFVCRDKKRRGPNSSIGGASYAIAPGGVYCPNSRTGSGIGGSVGGSFMNASQRSQRYGGSAAMASGGPYGNMYSHSSSKIQPQDFRPMSPSRYSENVGSVGGGSLGANYWGQNTSHPPSQSGVRVQYMVAPRHFGASPNPMQPGYASVNDSEHNTRPSQISSSGFGGSQSQAIPQCAVEQHQRSSSPSSKSARSNGAASSYVNAGSGIHQPFFPQQPVVIGKEDEMLVMNRDEAQQELMFYGRSTQQVNL